MSLLEKLKSRGVVRVAVAYLAVAWLALQLAEILFPAYGFGDAAMRNLVVLLGAGLVVVVAFSWFFEWTGKGIVRENARALDEPDARVSPAGRDRRLNRFTILVLALAVAFFLVDKFVLDPARDRAREQQVAEQTRAEMLQESLGERSIAVLPFRDLSPSGDQAYLSAGVSEELLNLLTRIPGLRVAGRASTVTFSDAGATPGAIAEALSVTYLLDGSVSRAGDRIRVSAQLLDPATGTQLWSDRYERRLDDIFAVQDEIAARVAQELRLRLAGDLPTTRAIRPEAYEQFLKARFLLYQFELSPETLAEAERLLNAVLASEPDYVPALGQLWALSLNRRSTMSPADFEAQMRSLLDRLVAADPDSADTLNARAQWAYYGEGDRARGVTLMEQSLRADPDNLNAYRLAVFWLLDLEQYDDAITVARRLVLREPACGRCFNALGNAYRGARRYADGLEAFREFAERGPVPPGFHWNTGVLALGAGDPQAALDAWAREESDVGEIWRLMAIHDLGREEEFETRFAAFRRNPDHPESIARVYAHIGDAERAFEWLAKMFDPASEAFIMWVDSDIYDPIKSDPRWDVMLREQYDVPDDLPTDLRLELPPELRNPD